MIQMLPDTVTMQDIMDELYFKAKVDVALQELDEGKYISHDDAKKSLGKWLTK